MSMPIKGLRLARGWSQEQLAERSGLSVRTVQRLEQGRTPGLHSAEALARALDVDVTDLRPPAQPGAGRQDPIGSVREGLRGYADFDGTADRPQYWWFLMFVVLAGSLGSLAGAAVGSAVLLLLLVPLLAAGARRLHDTGRSGWWQLLALVPFGAVVPLILLAGPAEATAEPEPAGAE